MQSTVFSLQARVVHNLSVVLVKKIWFDIKYTNV